MLKWIKKHFSKENEELEESCNPTIDSIRITNTGYRFYLPDDVYDRERDILDIRELEEFIFAHCRFHGSRCEQDECYYRKNFYIYHETIKEILFSYEKSMVTYMDRAELNYLKELAHSISGSYDDLVYDYPFNKEFNENLTHILEEYYSFDEIKNNYNNKLLKRNEKILQLAEENEDLKTDLDRVRNRLKDINSTGMKSYQQGQNIKRNDDTKLTRSSPQVLKWKSKVLKRDKICQCCGSETNLEIHHLSAFVTHNERGADMDNGIVLCKKCHKQYHSQYGINGITNNPVTLAKFLRENGIQLQSRLESFNEDSNIFSEIMEGK